MTPTKEHMRSLARKANVQKKAIRKAADRMLGKPILLKVWLRPVQACKLRKYCRDLGVTQSEYIKWRLLQ